MGPKISEAARQRHAADQEAAGRLFELINESRAAEERLRAAEAGGASAARLRELGQRLDAALTDAMRAAYAARRVAIGPRGYADRIYRRKAMAKPEVKALTAEAERLLTLREEHRLNGVVCVPLAYASD